MDVPRIKQLIGAVTDRLQATLSFSEVGEAQLAVYALSLCDNLLKDLFVELCLEKAPPS